MVLPLKYQLKYLLFVPVEGDNRTCKYWIMIYGSILYPKIPKKKKQIRQLLIW